MEMDTLIDQLCAVRFGIQNAHHEIDDGEPDLVVSRTSPG